MKLWTYVREEMEICFFQSKGYSVVVCIHPGEGASSGTLFWHLLTFSLKNFCFIAVKLCVHNNTVSGDHTILKPLFGQVLLEL